LVSYTTNYVENDTSKLEKLANRETEKNRTEQNNDNCAHKYRKNIQK